MTNRPALLLHIGTHKTGSTALQVHMARSRKRLARNGFHYAESDRPPRPHKSKHAFLVHAALSGHEEVQRVVRQLVAEMEETGCRSLILSNERLSSPALCKGAAFERLALLGEVFDLQVVAFLRRQDYFIESLWNQWAKTGIMTQGIAEFCRGRKIREHIDYFAMLENWGTLGRVTAVNYHDARQRGVYPAFSEVAGTPPIPRQEPRKANDAIAMQTAAAMVVLNEAGIEFEKPAAAHPQGSAFALGRSLRRQILESTRESNAWLERVYGVRFPDDMPEEPETPIELPSTAAAERLLRGA